MNDECTHRHKVMLHPKWAISTGEMIVKSTKRSFRSYCADIDLWFCKDCSQGLLHDWHTGQYFEPTYQSEAERAATLGIYND